MKLISKDKEKIAFAGEIEDSLANAIRRSASEIPVLAINIVKFHKNDSALYDEIIAHRLGLVPLKTEKTFTEREKCTCKGKGCAKCSVELKLSGKGPKTVYSSDMKGKATVVYKMPIVFLDQDQELEFIAKAKLGKALEHAKFSPGLVHYRHVPEFEISRECDSCKQCIEACPQKLLSGEKKIEIKDIYKCDSCEACVEACKKHGKNAIKIKQSKEIIFFVESFGQLDPEDIFTNAVKALNKNLDELKKIK